MNHLLLGASIPFAIGVLVYSLRRFRAGLGMLIALPFLMAATAFWAGAPDLPRILGWLDLYYRLDADPRMNIFLWHHSLDAFESGSMVWPAVGLAAILACLLWAAWRELDRAEKERP